MIEEMKFVTERVFSQLFGNRPFTGIEIGVLAGGWTHYTLSHFPNCLMIHAVDPWSHFEDNLYERELPQSTMDQHFSVYCNKMTEFPGRYTTWKMESSDAIRHLKDVKVDFVFIDGCHDRRFVDEDIRNYFPLVVDGGFFGGHDYGQVEDVTVTVNKHFRDFHEDNDHVWWFQKKPGQKLGE